jgi:L-2-hydroxyglutarate oxidase LhgO
MTQQIECVVIGAGVVGLAVARALAMAGREVVVLESAAQIGTGISSRSSEVIHAGIYYPEDSAKARLCVKGRDRLYAYCHERGIAHRRCGKLIVAADEDQSAALEGIAGKAVINGVDDLLFFSRAQALRAEPELRCAAALYSPSTGIIDSHAYMLSLQGDAERHGAVFVFNTSFSRAFVEEKGILLHVQEGQWIARNLINCAGLSAPLVAASIDGLSASHVPEARYAKGNYFACRQRVPFSHLIYPVPEVAGLGVHLTFDLAGRARFGPDVEWVDAPDYTVDIARAERFYAAIRRYWPALRDGALSADYAGVRPKLAGNENGDFRIDDVRVHGVPGLINLLGIESPGLTASLALAEWVTGLVN